MTLGGFLSRFFFSTVTKIGENSQVTFYGSMVIFVWKDKVSFKEFSIEFLRKIPIISCSFCVKQNEVKVLFLGGGLDQFLSSKGSINK